MNERILELAKQAGLKFPSETDLSPPEKKFAELIVREVLAVQEKLIAEGHNAWHLNGPTKKYFGVE